jgi:hypothetical protein
MLDVEAAIEKYQAGTAVAPKNLTANPFPKGKRNKIEENLHLDAAGCRGLLRLRDDTPAVRDTPLYRG